MRGHFKGLTRGHHPCWPCFFDVVFRAVWWFAILGLPVVITRIYVPIHCVALLAAGIAVVSTRGRIL